ncbi:component of the polarisome [Collariella sp. IMI 366227]|nr:component of the polarisome [Collariella sp. IMI 366227]
MNGRNAPLSPVSLGGSEWSYPTGDNSGPPYQNNRGQLSTPPDSAGPIKLMNGNYSPSQRSVGGPSPPPSVGRSSAGTNLYARSESGRSQSQQSENQELVLSEHYISLKRYLSATSRDGNPKPPPNKARDKLQRLTGVQFLELSTDVYDELKRRELAHRHNRAPNAGPHPGPRTPPTTSSPRKTSTPSATRPARSSQARAPRFRDLATDVFCELERRFPRFAGESVPRVGSPASMRGGPASRSQTPVSGMGGYGPRGQSRRRPSEASSVRSGRGLPGTMSGGFPMPPSPSVANGEYGRPMPKQFQSNTIVPNKSTMVEEDDDAVSPLSPNPATGDAYGLGRAADDRDSKRSAGQLESDKKLIEEYELQVRELREKLNNMEDASKKKEDELMNILDAERSKAAAVSAEKKEWEEAREDLENRIAEAEELNDSLHRELDRIRGEHMGEVRQLREEIEQAQQSASNNINNVAASGLGNPELERENKELRMALEEQESVAEEVRREAQQFLQEMREISQHSDVAWERQAEMEKTIDSLEHEVREWQNRYARTKTQLRDMRGSSAGLTVDVEASKYIREKGFVEDNGLVKDIHVTKFQLAIDEILQRARADSPERVIDAMKAVVVSVRRITKDIDGSAQNGELAMQHQKLKSRVSSTANNLITASKNFAHSAGISPVFLVDVAASHLVAAVVELLRTAKIRATPADELEEEDDGTITPVDSSGFFSPQSNGQSQIFSMASNQDTLPPHPPSRASAPAAESAPPTTNGGNLNKALPSTQPRCPPPTTTITHPHRHPEDLKIYLEDQTAVLVQTIQELVQLIRNDAGIDQVTEEIDVITDVVGQVTAETQASAPVRVDC